jgi:hypothetical protein
MSPLGAPNAGQSLPKGPSSPEPHRGVPNAAGGEAEGVVPGD